MAGALTSETSETNVAYDVSGMQDEELKPNKLWGF
jgi:hypothetical protein